MYPSMHTKLLHLSSILFILIFKDLPLLDRVGSNYQCRDRSFILDNHIFRSVNRFLFDNFNLSSLAIYLATISAYTFEQGQFIIASRADSMYVTSFALSMAVNALVTGLIAFKILKVFLTVTKAVTTSVERTLGTTGGTQLRHVIFIIIESGMALFAIQLARFVLYNLRLTSESAEDVYIIFIGINEMFNVIIRPVRFYFFCFTDKIYYPDRASHQQ